MLIQPGGLALALALLKWPLLVWRANALGAYRLW
jgi:hypothetical protein